MVVTRALSSKEVDASGEELTNVRIAAVLVSPDDIPIVNYVGGETIRPQPAPQTRTDDDGDWSLGIVPNEIMDLDSRYRIVSQVVNSDGTYEPLENILIYMPNHAAVLDDLIVDGGDHSGGGGIPTIPRTIYMWSQADTSSPSAIPMDAVRGTSMLSITLTVDAYVVFAQRAELDDFAMVTVGGFDVLPVYEKGAMPFEFDGASIEYWVSLLDQRAQTITYQFVR